MYQANHCIIILVVSYQFVWFIVALLIAGTYTCTCTYESGDALILLPDIFCTVECVMRYSVTSL